MDIGSAETQRYVAKFNSLLQTIQQRTEAVKSFSDRLTTISIGALAITMNYRKEIGANGYAARWILHATWIGFSLSILGFLLLYVGHIRDHDRLIEKMQKNFWSGSYQIDFQKFGWIYVFGYRALVGGFSWGAAGLLALGILGR